MIAGVAQDLAGNNNTSAAAFTRTYDSSVVSASYFYYLDGATWVQEADPPADTIAVAEFGGTTYSLNDNDTLYRLESTWSQDAAGAPTGSLDIAGGGSALYAVTAGDELYAFLTVSQNSEPRGPATRL